MNPFWFTTGLDLNMLFMTWLTNRGSFNSLAAVEVIEAHA